MADLGEKGSKILITIDKIGNIIFPALFSAGGILTLIGFFPAWCLAILAIISAVAGISLTVWNIVFPSEKLSKYIEEKKK
jgi:uncharacterized membrane protein YphA (DoxX/SURF4 family)